jgi:hypothetical protein
MAHKYKRGHIPWNKGLSGLHLSPKSEFKKGMIPWNKGKKLSKQHCHNLSIAHMGIKQSEESIEKRVLQMRGEQHPLWKGDDVGYYALHVWVKRNYGLPIRCEYEGCHYPRYNMRNELMLKPKRYHWANITGIYNRDRTNWKMMCASCHGFFDSKRRRGQ